MRLNILKFFLAFSIFLYYTVGCRKRFLQPLINYLYSPQNDQWLPHWSFYLLEIKKRVQDELFFIILQITNLHMMASATFLYLQSFPVRQPAYEATASPAQLLSRNTLPVPFHVP